MSPPLSVVADNSAPQAKAAPKLNELSERIRHLQAEAKHLAREHIRSLEAALIEVERLSAEISEGGEAYPAGVRDIARRLAEDCEHKVQAIEAIASRN
ncbi:MAG: hypothetical protein Q8Q88_05315 [Phenylobacterium sp.]|uniref:hypothetical protein n=1 Tax=Phenylobacterium sp. TaxID=1871053 RepID=UPI0027339640|nr:hypothetical protein [Phenylobacterium sp.]MDP3746453.1 hypothetical protein [Phenylobacterium sp.]